MDLDDIFLHRKKESKKYRNYGYYNNHTSGNTFYGYDKNFRQKAFIRGLLNNPSLRKFVIIISVAIIVVLIIFAAILFPLIKDLFTFVTDNGIQGILDKLLVLLEKIWSGTSS